MRFRFRWIALALCALLCLTCLSPALADFGGFDSDGDYDDGDYDDSDSGGDYGGSNYGDRDYGGSNRSRSSDRRP